MIWLYGRHAVMAALGNSRRHVRKIFLSRTLKDLEDLKKKFARHKIEIVPLETFFNRFGHDAVHQGIALETEQLSHGPLEDLVEATSSEKAALFVMLDQVTDPHNVGAIARSAAAFGAKSLIMPKHQSAPQDSAILAKTACGGIEHVAMHTVTNLSQTLEKFKKAGYWCIGLDEKGEGPLQKAPLVGKIVLVLGAEGKGLRRLTKENCDLLSFLPTNPLFPTLNVSNAAALSFYEYARQNS